MEGAREYAELFGTCQIGRLFLKSGRHARGRTFHIYILPEGESVFMEGKWNPNAVEVYGIVKGASGGTESYGWLHRGKWEEDFYALVQQQKAVVAKANAEQKEQERNKKQAEQERIKSLLDAY